MKDRHKRAPRPRERRHTPRVDDRIDAVGQSALSSNYQGYSNGGVLPVGTTFGAPYSGVMASNKKVIVPIVQAQQAYFDAFSQSIWKAYQGVAQGLMAGLSRSEGYFTAEEVEAHEATYPTLPVVEGAFTAWKRAMIEPVQRPRGSFGYLNVGPVKPGARYRFKGVIGGRYDAVADAECERSGFARPEHKVPYVDCTCGFHGLRYRTLLAEAAADYRWYSSCDLEVQLSGRFIEGELGWRAEHQEVVSVRVDTTCYRCRRDDVSPVGLVDSTYRLAAVCAECLESLEQLHWAFGDSVEVLSLAEVGAGLGVHDIRWGTHNPQKKGELL